MRYFGLLKNTNLVSLQNGIILQKLKVQIVPKASSFFIQSVFLKATAKKTPPHPRKVYVKTLQRRLRDTLANDEDRARCIYRRERKRM